MQPAEPIRTRTMANLAGGTLQLAAARCPCPPLGRRAVPMQYSKHLQPPAARCDKNSAVTAPFSRKSMPYSDPFFGTVFCLTQLRFCRRAAKTGLFYRQAGSTESSTTTCSWIILLELELLCWQRIVAATKGRAHGGAPLSARERASAFFRFRASP